VLPLELLDFRGKLENKAALLSWTTAQEKDVLGFEIERSIDQKSFEKIGFVAAKNQVSTQSYSFNDIALKQMIQYYRLKINDLDGSFTYSKVIAIQTAERGGKAAFVLAPNPVSTEMQVVFSSLPESAFDLRITDRAGRRVLEQHYSTSEAKTLTIPVNNLLAGHYIVTVQMPNGTVQSVKMHKL
jgi:hypothetical protein